jgi:prepilin-type N-terminal cleavage/methylation domain-containing protein
VIRHNAHTAHGFTLLEIMLALLVISIGIVSMIGLLSSSVDSSAKSHQDITAVTFADMILNYCHAEGFDALPTDTGLTFIDPNGRSAFMAYNSMETYTGELPGFGNALSQEYIVSYRMQVTEWTNTKSIHLEVWPGISTSTVEPHHFYTEMYNWNRMP